MVIENGELSLYAYNQSSTTDQNVSSSSVSNITLFPTGDVSIGHKISGVAKLDVNGSILSRGVSNASGKLMLNDSSNTYNISLQSPALSSSYTLTLPTTDGNNNQVLQTDGSGTLSWVDQTAAISNLSDIGDVSSASPSTNDALVWNGSSWSPSAVASGGSSGNSFETIAVSGQSDVVAESSTDTLTLVAGDGINITTNSSSDTITIENSNGYASLSQPTASNAGQIVAVNSAGNELEYSGHLKELACEQTMITKVNFNITSPLDTYDMI